MSRKIPEGIFYCRRSSVWEGAAGQSETASQTPVNYSIYCSPTSLRKSDKNKDSHISGFLELVTSRKDIFKVGGTHCGLAISIQLPGCCSTMKPFLNSEKLKWIIIHFKNSLWNMYLSCYYSLQSSIFFSLNDSVLIPNSLLHRRNTSTC